MSDGGKAAIQADDQVVGAGEVRALKKRIRDLDRMLGKKTMEVEILQEAIAIAREKNCSRALCCLGRTVPDEAVAEVLTVSRSRLAERVKEPLQGRPPSYSKAEDEMLLPLIRDIIDYRLTYGYRRVCAVLNHRLKQEGHASVNHKREYLIMRLHVLLLANHKGYRPNHSMTAGASLSKAISGGVLMALSFTAAATKTCMWSLLRPRGHGAHCDYNGHQWADGAGSDVGVRGEAVWSTEGPHPVEWLSDNGPC